MDTMIVKILLVVSLVSFLFHDPIDGSMLVGSSNGLGCSLSHILNFLAICYVCVELPDL